LRADLDQDPDCVFSTWPNSALRPEIGSMLEIEWQAVDAGSGENRPVRGTPQYGEKCGPGNIKLILAENVEKCSSEEREASQFWSQIS
jgi:hypothetical protein